MDIKIAFLLFCAVVTTECQFPQDSFYFPGVLLGISERRQEGTFHATKGPINSFSLKPNSQQQENYQSRPDEYSYSNQKFDQDFGNKHSQSSKNSQKFQNVDERQQSVPNRSQPGSEPNFSNSPFNPSNHNDPHYTGSGPIDSDRKSGNQAAYNGQGFSSTRPDPSSQFQPGRPQNRPDSFNKKSPNRNPIIQSENEEKFEDYKPITEFSWNLFKYVSNPQLPNFVISPLAPQHLLSYLASGAVGDTKDEIVRAIKYKSPKQLNSLVSTMLREPGNKELQLASALFVSNRIGISPEFQRNLAENTKIVPTDFSNTEGFNRQYSNWVAEKTKGALKNARVKPDPSTRMLMTSAVYFKGEWIFKLNPGGTEDFYVTENQPVKVPMMKLLKKLPYGKLNGNLGEWISLPYNSNDSMVIILPRENLPVEELIQKLNVQDIFDSMTIDSYGNVTLTLPRFKVESKSSLVVPLQQMGIQQLFSTNAQLPNIFSSNEPLTVSSVLQQASLEVNEQGSIATSLTAVGVVALSFSPPTPDVVFNVNRPFVAMIIDRKINFPYFIAKISNPSI